MFIIMKFLLFELKKKKDRTRKWIEQNLNRIWYSIANSTYMCKYTHFVHFVHFSFCAFKKNLIWYSCLDLKE